MSDEWATQRTDERIVSWHAEVVKTWGGQYYAPDVAYTFSNGRQFKSTDQTESGVYRRT